jgi:hypothetical protein
LPVLYLLGRLGVVPCTSLSQYESSQSQSRQERTCPELPLPLPLRFRRIDGHYDWCGSSDGKLKFWDAGDRSVSELSPAKLQARNALRQRVAIFDLDNPDRLMPLVSLLSISSACQSELQFMRSSLSCLLRKSKTRRRSADASNPAVHSAMPGTQATPRRESHYSCPRQLKRRRMRNTQRIRYYASNVHQPLPNRRTRT